MAKEFIERGAAIKAIENDCLELIYYTKEDAIQCVKAIPAADVAEVVRCEDCIRRGTEDCAMYYGCECGEQHTWEMDNDFCSWGERRDNA
jgi:hypothetical protein